MDEFDFDLEHIIFVDRKCKSCGVTKNLIDDFYLSRKDRGSLPSAYSYECKECTKKRVTNARKTEKTKKIVDKWEYPDW